MPAHLRHRSASCGTWDLPPTPLEYRPASAPVVSVELGRPFGSPVIVSGGLHAPSSFAQRHQLSFAPNDHDALLPRTGTHIAGPSRPKCQSKRGIDIQRPRSSMSPSTSSPLNRGLVQRIDNRHDVLTPDSYFDPDLQTSPLGRSEALEPPNDVIGPSKEPSPVEQCRQRISELQTEVELLKTETEVQRRAREKYQKLYESTALCQICMEHRRNAFILPCSHFVYCYACLQRHWEVNCLKQCPLCRGPAHSVMLTNLV